MPCSAYEPLLTMLHLLFITVNLYSYQMENFSCALFSYKSNGNFGIFVSCHHHVFDLHHLLIDHHLWLSCWSCLACPVLVKKAFTEYMSFKKMLVWLLFIKLVLEEMTGHKTLKWVLWKACFPLFLHKTCLHDLFNYLLQWIS